MNIEKVAYAIWPWGTKTREQMEVAAKELTEVGFKCFESVKAAIYAYDLDVKAYKEVLNRYSLKPVSFYFHLPPNEQTEDFFKNLDAELNFVAEVGVKTITIQSSGGRIAEETFKEEIEYEMEKLLRIAETAKQYGIKSGMHSHDNTKVMLGKEIDYIMERTTKEQFGFVPDIAHLIAGGCDPVEYIKKYADRVSFTHLKDFKMGEDVGTVGPVSAGREVYKNFSELGKGSVDFKKIMEILDEAGFDSYHCIELDSAPISNKESAKNNFEFIKSL